MECKVSLNLISERSILRINRNIVECKVISYPNATCPLFCVLIETLWNVKLSLVLRLQNHPYRINRNIVECKDYTKIEITECYESY